MTRWPARPAQPRSGDACAMLALLLLLFPGPVVAFEDAEVGAIVGNVKTKADYPNAGGVWMGRQKVVQVDGVGNVTTTEHLLARVLDPAWAERSFRPYARTYWSKFTSLLVARARVWHSREAFEDLPAEAVVDSLAPGAEGAPVYQYLRVRLIQFPALKPGDVVELRLVWNLQIPPDEYNVRWLEEVFGAAEPVVEQQLTLITPLAATIRTETAGPRLLRQSAPRKDLLVQTWLTGNLDPVPAKLLETPMARIPIDPDSVTDAVSRVFFTSVPDWSYLSEYLGKKWYYAWNRRDLSMDRILGQLLADAVSTEDRARAVERYVQQEIRTLAVPMEAIAARPLDAGAIARDRVGVPLDKACLLVSLLRMAGLEASPVLVRARGGPWDRSLPVLSQFDQVLARVKIAGGQYLWLDPVLGTHALRPGEGLLLNGPTEGPEAGGQAGLVPFPGLPAGTR